MRFSECEEKLDSAINSRMEKQKRMAEFQELYSSYQAINMTISAEYVRRTAETEYSELIDSIKRIQHILRHSSDMRLRAIAAADMVKIRTEMKQNKQIMHSIRSRINYITTQYNEAIRSKNYDAEQQLKQILTATYFYVSKHTKNDRNYTRLIPKSDNMTRFSHETTDMMLHDAIKSRHDIRGQLYNTQCMN